MATKKLNNRQMLIKIMKDKNLNSREIAEMIGYVPETVRAWKCGRYPTPDIAIKLLTLQTQ